MQRLIAYAVVFAGLVAAFIAGPADAQVQTVRVGWCAKTVSSAAAPFAIATKLGWFEKDGIKVDLVPLPGSTDCVKLVATKELQASLPYGGEFLDLGVIQQPQLGAGITGERVLGIELRQGVDLF